MTPDDAAAIRALDHNITHLRKSVVAMGTDMTHEMLARCAGNMNDTSIPPLDRVIYNAAIVGILTLLIEPEGDK